MAPDAPPCPAGKLDPTFGTAGITNGLFVPGSTKWLAAGTPRIAIDPAGRIVLAGWAKDNEGVIVPVTTRLLANGDRDPKYATVLLEEDGGVLRGEHAALVIHDKVWALAETDHETWLVRYGADGTPDPTFGANGRVMIDQGLGSRYFNALAIDDGSIANVVGYDRTFSKGGFLVHRVDPDGSLLLDVEIGGYDRASAAGVVLLPDGTPVIGGDITLISPFRQQSGLFRVAKDGHLDTDFTNRSSTGPGLWSAFALALAPDQSFYMGGITSEKEPAVAHFLPDGTFDTAFGVKGIAPVGTFPEDTATPRSIVLDAAGNVIVATELGDSNGPRCALTRLAPDGSPDPTFDGGGALVLEFVSDCQMVLQADGRLLLAGAKRILEPAAIDMVVARICL